MNKNISNVVELTEKELECVSGGMSPEQKKHFEEWSKMHEQKQRLRSTIGM